MHLILCVILVLRIVHATVAFKSPPTTLQKCCSIEEQFSLNDMNELECKKNPRKTVNNLDTQELSSEWQWFVNDLLQTPENKTISFKTKPNCSSSSMDTLYNGHNRHEFNLVVKDNEAFLELLKNESINDRSITFPSSSFCVDAGPGSMLVALLCPCVTVMCVRKCCGTSQAYNETQSACEDSRFDGDVFSESEDETFGKLEYYLLASRRLDCSKRYFYQMMYNNTSGPSFFLLNNGSLQMQNSFDNLIDWTNSSYYHAFGLHWKLARKVGDIHSSIENAMDTGWIFQPEDYCWDFTADDKRMIQVCYTGEIVVDVYQLFGVLFMTVSFALLIVTVIVLITAHLCFCQRVYKSDV